MSDKADRARQFMPFAALKGYDELVRKQEKIISPRREMSEYKAECLSNKLNLVKKGMVIKMSHFYPFLREDFPVLSVPLRLKSQRLPYQFHWSYGR